MYALFSSSSSSSFSLTIGW
jgi:chromatin remodeling complex protein RSC6